MFSKVGQNNDSSAAIGWLIGVVIVIAVIIYAAYFVAIIGSIFGGGVSIINYFKSFKKNIIDENFRAA